MKQLCAALNQTGSIALLALISLGTMPASAQENTTTTETSAQEATAASADEICEALQRAEARRQKWLNEGIPEEFGSEEPFSFDPTKC